MVDGLRNKYKHFVLSGYTETERFVRPRQAIRRPQIPMRDRQSHGTALLGQIDRLKAVSETARRHQEEAGLEEGFGLQVEFESFPDIELAFERLARERSGIELLNVRQDPEKEITYATVFVPHGKLAHFENLIRSYLEEKRDRRGRVRDHKDLVNAIRKIRAATLRALWTDDPSVLPLSESEAFWWEVWLPVGTDPFTTVENFRRLAEAQGFRVAEGELRFPERTVLLMYASAGDMTRSMMVLNSIAELRRGKETAEFFDTLPPEEQSEWMDELLGRCRFSRPSAQVPHVCILDTGINNGHPLVAPALASQDLHTVKPAWGKEDSEGHGTKMAGLALTGDLREALSSDETIQIPYRLESAKLLPRDGANVGDPCHHGYIMTEAIARPEITDPNRRRVFGMAVTTRDDRDRGRPSAWSAAVDRLAAGADGNGSAPRLLVVSAGNIHDPNAWMEYANSNSTEGIHDPAQAWNALTVGAYTNLVDISEPDAGELQPIACAGGLSPFSTTSSTWQEHWPLKPDVLFEGGNAAQDALGAVEMASLSLLTCHHLPMERLFTTANGTSAATALATRMAAQLMAAYPDLWPESIRGLIVHSAGWTEAMLRCFLPEEGSPSKRDYANLIRHCGFGVPDLDRAAWSVSNSLTMVVQAHLRPFQRERDKPPKLREMNLHQLPWPLAALESLAETQVEMRVTLSYFIEPNPSRRGYRSRYSYESHGLRFEVKRPHESEADFRARINAAARDEEGTVSGGSDPGWLIGKQGRHKGSFHSDIWCGSAVDLASRGVLAVYPSLGWWKTRPRLQRYDNTARYCLIVSIRAPETEVDLYTEVANQITVPVTVGF